MTSDPLPPSFLNLNTRRLAWYRFSRCLAVATLYCSSTASGSAISSTRSPEARPPSLLFHRRPALPITAYPSTVTEHRTSPSPSVHRRATTFPSGLETASDVCFSRQEIAETTTANKKNRYFRMQQLFRFTYWSLQIKAISY